MTEVDNMIAAFEKWMDDAPTLRCGEGGCDSCASAFRRSCEPILPAQIPEPEISDGIPEFYWEPDTELDIRSSFADDYLEYDLGGEG